VNDDSDVAAIQEIVAAFYGTFDNRSQQEPDGVRLRNMCMPDAIIRCLKDGSAAALSLRDFLEPRLQLLRNGSLVDFHEWEVVGHTTILGDIATHSSIYRKEGNVEGERHVGSGRKLMQLCRLSGSWHIASLLWADD